MLAHIAVKISRVARVKGEIAVAYRDGLERAGYDVTVANNGQDALGAITLVKPDIVLLDLIMPKMNGFEVLKAIKADPALASIPVIVLSNLSQVTDESEVRRLGATDFLIKADYSLKQIIEKVESVLSAAK